VSEHHFVVQYNPAKGWEWVPDVEEAHFSGTIFLEDDCYWVNSSHSEEINRIDTEASKQLCAMLEIANGANALI
jgi:hypothetical protein